MHKFTGTESYGHETQWNLKFTIKKHISTMSLSGQRKSLMCTLI